MHAQISILSPRFHKKGSFTVPNFALLTKKVNFLTA